MDAKARGKARIVVCMIFLPWSTRLIGKRYLSRRADEFHGARIMIDARLGRV
jgi:hypothetical protein